MTHRFERSSSKSLHDVKEFTGGGGSSKMVRDAEGERDTVARDSRMPGIGQGRQSSSVRRGLVAFIATALFATALFAALAQPVAAQREITFNAPSGLTVVAGQSIVIDASDYASDPGFVISCANPTGVDSSKVWVTRASGTCDFTVRASVSAVAGNTTFSTVLSSSRTGSTTLTATFTVTITPMSVPAGGQLTFLMQGQPAWGAVGFGCSTAPTGVDASRYSVTRPSGCFRRITVESSATTGPASFTVRLSYANSGGQSWATTFNFVITPASNIIFTAPPGGLTIPVGQFRNFDVSSYATDGDYTISCRFSAASRHSLIASVANTGCDFTVRAGRTAGAATLSVIYNSDNGGFWPVGELTAEIPITVADPSSLTFTAPSALNVRVGQTIGINARLYASDGANAVACDVATGIVGGITVKSPGDTFGHPVDSGKTLTLGGCSYRVTAGNTVGTASFVVPYVSSSGRTLNGRININILSAAPTIFFTAPTGLSVAAGGVITIDASGYAPSAYSVSCGTITQSHALIASIFEEGCSIELTVGNTAGTATFTVPYTNAEGGALDGVISLVIGSVPALAVAGCTDGTFVDTTANPRVAGANNDLVEDCQALVAAQNLWAGVAANGELRSPYFIRSWGTGTPEQQKIDSWEGVTVTSGRVTALEIDNTGEEDGISGTIPTELGDLTALTTLDLSSHQISGTIPTQLGSLTALTALDLSGNQLTGAIPSQIGSLAGLTFLDLSGNQLSGAIPSQIGSLTALTSLYLSSNELTGAIPIQIGSLAGLTALSLSGNQLSGAIPSQIGSLAALTFLDLSGNQLSGAILSQIVSLTDLTSLNLSSNELTGAIPTQIGSLTDLTSLDLSGNELTGAIPSQIGSLTDLTSLDLSGNELSGAIPSQIGSLTALTILDLSSNELSGAIPSQIGSLTALTSLDLSSNELTWAIPFQLGSLTALTSLDLSSNDLIGTIPSQLGSLNSLVALDLSSNRLIGSVPAAIGFITTLSTFSICDNQLTGALPTSLRTGVTLLGYPTADGYTPIACQNPVEPQPEIPQPETPQPTSPQPTSPQPFTPTPTPAPSGGEDATGDVAVPRWNTLTVSGDGITASEIRSTLGIPANYGIYTWNERTQTWTRVTSSSQSLSAGTLVSFRTVAAPDPDLLDGLNLGSGSETVSLNRGWNLINVPSVVTLTEDSTFLIDDSLIDCDNLQGIVAVASYSASNRRWSLWLPCNPRTQARLTTGRNAPYLVFTRIAPGDTTYFYNNARQPIDIIWDTETQTYQVAN